VFTCTTATLFVVGRRTKDVVETVLGKDFANWLMSDGYGVYREFHQRLRCLAHIIRKARGLAESLDQKASGFGTQVLDTLNDLIEAVYQARAAPPDEPLRERFAAQLDALYRACVHYAESEHAKTRALARELLNDWDTCWVVLDHPELPLTNMEPGHRKALMPLRSWPARSTPAANARPHPGFILPKRSSSGARGCLHLLFHLFLLREGLRRLGGLNG